MPDIHLLTNEISDLIAAGEVIERPSSVVKELVENSIDAEADQITVEIVGGGLKKIRVTDNGCGMNSINAEKCFLKHATSKILNKEDLFSIRTLGFRGEAIPSIAAVSRIKLSTKEKDGVLGYEVVCEGGLLKEKGEAGLADGTTFEVSDLFFNTPARLKFMKSEQAETGVINSLIEKLALSHPNISFKFLSNGSVKLFTPGNGKVSDAIYAIYGREFASRLLQVDYDEGNVKITGYTGKPLLNKPNRNFQVFFVNGRLIRSRVLQQSLEQCYKNAMLVGRYPCCVIFLTVPFAEVDINVHPSKTEIKFAEDTYIANHVSKAISLALRNDKGIFEVEDKTKDEKTVFASFSKEDIIKDSYPSVKQTEAKPITVVKETEVEILQKPIQANKTTPKSVVSEDVKPIKTTEKVQTFGNWKITTEEPIYAKPESISAVTDDSLCNNKPLNVASERLLFDDEIVIKKESVKETIKETSVEEEAVETPLVQETLFETKEIEPTDNDNNIQTEVLEIQPEIIPIQEAVFRIIGEAFKTYIIIEKEEELLLIDKHALHERMIFERLKKESGISSQILLTPYTCNLGASENEIIVSHKNELSRLGFDVSDFGTALMIREIPDIISTSDIDFILSKAAENFRTNKTISEEIFDELLYVVACKAAIKSGYNTTTAELEALIKEYLNNKDSLRYCPHGRPITVSFTEKFIEKQFKRIV